MQSSEFYTDETSKGKIHPFQLGNLLIETQDVVAAAKFISQLFDTNYSFDGESCKLKVGENKVRLVSSDFFFNKYEFDGKLTTILSVKISNASEFCNKAILYGGTVLKKTPDWALVEGRGGLHVLLEVAAPRLPQQAPVSRVYTESESEQETKRDSFTQQRNEPREFPRVGVEIFSKGEFVPVEPNSKAPIPYENEYFKGFCFVAMRAAGKPVNPRVANMFEGKQRLSEFQFQGKFKQVPRGSLWFGAELAGPLQLNLMTRGLSKVLLKFTKARSHGQVHYSLGNSNLSVLPHFSAPFQTTVDKLIKTPEGEVPPPMGQWYNEPEESVNRRKKSGEFEVELDTTSTFSFSVQAMYINFPEWEPANIPVSIGNLQTFWGDSKFRFGIYELGEEDQRSEHKVATNRYYTILQFSPSPTPETEALVDYQEGRIASQENAGMLGYQNIASETEVTDDENFYDAKSCESDSESDSDSETSTESGGRESHHRQQHHFRSRSTLASEPPQGIKDLPGTRLVSPRKLSGSLVRGIRDLKKTFSMPNMTLRNQTQMKVTVDTAVSSDIICPLWVQVRSAQRYRRRSQRSGILYMVVVNGELRLRSNKEFRRFFGTVNQKRSNSHLSAIEIRRRRYGKLVKNLQSSGKRADQEVLESFVGFKNHHDRKFLTQSTRLPSRIGKVLLQVQVCRALSTRHWVIEHGALTRDYLLFFRRRKKKPGVILPISSILQVRKLDADQFSIPTAKVVEISTLGRCHYLMLKDSDAAVSFVDILLNAIQGSRDSSFGPIQLSTAGGDEYQPDINLEENFVMHSCEWKSKNHKVLNCRKLSFMPQDFQRDQNPCHLVKDLLQQGVSLGNTYGSEGLAAFLDGSCMLRSINLSVFTQSLSLDGKTAFFLNLYHLMVVHGFIVLGVPQNSSYFSSFFLQISYEFGDSMFSLAELEHCIIRANMSRPHFFLSKLYTPQSRFSFGLDNADIRMLFAVNSGLIANPPDIMIYSADNLQNQLNQTAAHFLSCTVQVDIGRRKVSVPRLFQWFAADLGSSTTQQLDTIKQLSKGKLNQGIAALLETYEENPKHKPSISYNENRWKCQMLQLYA